MEDGVLAVRVADAIAESGSYLVPIHAHPEEMTWIEVGVDCRAERRDPMEGLDVEDSRTGVQLEADPQFGILGRRERGQIGPVGRDYRRPLPFVDAFQVGEPSARAEMRRPVG